MKETYNKIVNNKAFQIVKKLLSICLTVVLVLVFFIILVQKLSNNRFNLGGYGIYTIATGSMEPEYKVKDVLISIYSLFYMNNISCPFSPNMADELRNNKAFILGAILTKVDVKKEKKLYGYKYDYYYSNYNK